MERSIIQKHIEDIINEKCSKKEQLESVLNSLNKAGESYDQFIKLGDKKIEDFHSKYKGTDSWGEDENDFYITLSTKLEYAKVQKEFIDELYDGMANVWEIPTSNIDLSALDGMQLRWLQDQFYISDGSTTRGTVTSVEYGGGYPKLDASWFRGDNVNFGVIDSYPTDFNTSSNQNFKKDLESALDDCSKKTAKANEKVGKGFDLIEDEFMKRALS